MTMSLVQTVTVGVGGAASIQFTGIPQTGQDLYVSLSLRHSVATSDTGYIRFNNDSTTLCTVRYILGDGATASSAAVTNVAMVRFGNMLGTQTASTFDNGSIYIPNYTGSGQKSVAIEYVGENNATTAYQRITAGLWPVTSAITSITISNNAAGIAQYSTASLYTISTTGATGATVA